MISLLASSLFLALQLYCWEIVTSWMKGTCGRGICWYWYWTGYNENQSFHHAYASFTSHWCGQSLFWKHHHYSKVVKLKEILLLATWTEKCSLMGCTFACIHTPAHTHTHTHTISHCAQIPYLLLFFPLTFPSQSPSTPNFSQPNIFSSYLKFRQHFQSKISPLCFFPFNSSPSENIRKYYPIS